MKSILFIVFATLGFALGQTTEPSPAQLAESFYQRGLAAEKAKDFPTAKTAYQTALKHNPNHANARFRLREMELNRKTIEETARRVVLDKVMLPAVRFDGASLQEALDGLATLIERESKPKQAPNFIVQDPDNKLDAAKITLGLRNIPASAALKYILDQAGAKARFDEHAVVIEPK